VTGVALPVGASASRAPRRAASERSAASRIRVELTLFAALGALGVAQWSRLVSDPPLGRLLLAVAIVTGGGALLALIGARPRPARAAIAAAVAVCATGAAAVAVGLPARLLAPANWGELIDNLSRGLAGIEDTEMPYDGGDVWLRLTLLLVAPVLLGIAAALAFWPARRRAVLRILALTALVTLYAIAVTLDSPGAELVWGALLLMLAASWLWVPGLEPRRTAGAVAAVAGAGLLALPVAARLDTAAPWWDYESWDWFARDSEVTFEWNHSYGPLEWPQDGTTLVEVHSAEPLYWKASVLDRFDGFTWQRARTDDPLAASERLARRRTPGGELPARHREWLSQASFEFEALSSGLVIGAGTTQVVQGLDDVRVSSDGTLRTGGKPLASGDEYSILTYSPRPTEAELRRAPLTYPERRFGRSTLIGLPATVPPELNALEDGFAPARAQAMPLWGSRPDAEVRAALLASPYSGVYQRARRLVAGAQTPYAAVRAIERHLRHGYDYSPNVPQHPYPLASFMFDDESGYCQQFAGTMALMLRMVGIPSRVVSGFAPGSYEAERRIYEVRDTDAHSWVEAYFRGIGWVTFDPTPAAAPAVSQSLNAELATFFRGRGAAPAQARDRTGSPERTRGGDTVGTTREDSGPWAVVALAVLGAATLLATVAAFVFWRRRRALASGTEVEAQLDELRRALGRLGWNLSGEATLLALEQRFRAAGRMAVAGYAAGLRAHRYAPGSPPPPGPAARRALRRALSAGGGVRRRLRGLLAIPPGGPR
jgi:protein-glutamine gamma-glutamyltransferase